MKKLIDLEGLHVFLVELKKIFATKNDLGAYQIKGDYLARADANTSYATQNDFDVLHYRTFDLPDKVKKNEDEIATCKNEIQILQASIAQLESTIKTIQEGGKVLKGELIKMAGETTITSTEVQKYNLNRPGDLILPDSVKSVDRTAFYRCDKLESITIPKCEKVDNSAFLDCLSLKEIVLPEAQDVSYCAFDGCKNLTTLVIHEHCQYVDILDLPKDCVIYNSDKSRKYNKIARRWESINGAAAELLVLNWQSDHKTPFTVPDGIKVLKLTLSDNSVKYALVKEKDNLEFSRTTHDEPAYGRTVYFWKIQSQTTYSSASSTRKGIMQVEWSPDINDDRPDIDLSVYGNSLDL